MACPYPTALDSDDAMLLVIDVQERLAAVMSNREQVVMTTTLLIGAAGVLGLPIIVTRQYPKGLGDTVPELAEALEAASALTSVDVVDKTSFCCAEELAVADTMLRVGRSQVIIAGMEAHICVAQTALAQAAQGGMVHVVADACCSRNDLDRDTAFGRLAHHGVTVTTAEAAIYEMVGRAGTDEFKAVLALVK